MIDPTYLRAVREGLLSGKLEKENEAELPEGIAELFDKELFTLNMAITEKQLLIHFFTSFALVQKEVTPEFIAEILEWDKEVVYEFIFKYSKWFSGSGNNQFRLYHDRFRVYVLQKITPKTFLLFNDKLILVCDNALLSNSNEQIERYALEFLSTHLFVNSMLIGDASKLKQFVYDSAIWERQIKISNVVDWGKKMFEEMMRWASKYDEEEIIECGSRLIYFLSFIKGNSEINSLDNQLTNIKALYHSNDYFKEKIESYFVLILDDITSNNERDVVKENVDKILIEFKKNIPLFDPEISCNNYWNDHISEKLVFFIAKELSKLNCEWKILFNNYFFSNNKSFFNSMYSEFDLDVKDLFLFKDIFELKKQDYQPELDSYLLYKTNSLLDISTALFQLNQHDEAKAIIKSIVNDNLLRFKDFLDKHKKRITAILFTFGYVDSALKIANSIKDHKIKEAAQRIVNEDDKLIFETKKKPKIELTSFEDDIIQFKTNLKVKKSDNNEDIYYHIALRYYFNDDEINGLKYLNKIENKNLLNNLYTELCINFTRNNNLTEAINYIDTKIVINNNKAIAIKYVVDELISLNFELGTAKNLVLKGINLLDYRESLIGKKLIRHFSYSLFKLGEHQKSFTLVNEMRDDFMKLLTEIDIDINFNSSKKIRQLIDKFNFIENINLYLKNEPNDQFILFEHIIEIVEKLYSINELELINSILNQVDIPSQDAWICKAIIYTLLGDLPRAIKFSEYLLYDKVGYDYLMKSIVNTLLLKKDFLNAEKVYLMIKSDEYRNDVSLDYSNYILNNEVKNYFFNSLPKCFNNNFFSSPSLTKNYLFRHVLDLPSKELKMITINQISKQLNFSNYNKYILISLMPFQINSKSFRFLLKIYYLNLLLFEKNNYLLKKHDIVLKELNLYNLI